jgi:hypothetical protein
MDIPDDEFDEDFGAPVPDGEELDRMLANARASGDVRLRRLIKHHQTLKHVAEFLLQRVEDLDDLPPDNQALKLARFVIRGT